MTVAIKVPSVGESITEGTISRWLKKDGDFVREEEPVFELETDKATTPVPSPASGTLRIGAREGETVQIGAVVGQVDPAGKAPAAGDNKKQAATANAVKEPAQAQANAAAPAKPQGEPILSPAARQLAADRGVDANAVAGTGRGRRVTKEDMVNFLDRQPAPQPAPPPTAPAPPPPAPTAGAPAAGPRETRQRMSAIRQRIAERLIVSQQTTATLTTFNEADMSAVLALRTRYKDRFREKHDINLGFMGFFVKACVAALKAYPAVNARIDGNEIVYQHSYNINIAVSTEQGLMVPVLRDADRLSFADIDKAIAALAVRAREGKITPADITGGTFTITNGGVFGSLVSTPILNPPQSAILGMHAIQKRPVVVDDQIVIRPMMYLALSYDHRLVDGREAVLFLVRVKECIEAPERLLLEV
jgi:2-oxoglutarate dehydrogenase E2 component (dihydrolipoamide succinyltransferase)